MQSRQEHQGAHTGIKTLLLVLLLGAAAAGGVWLFRGPARDGAKPGSGTGAREVALSDNTKAVLQRLDSPAEIRFYSLLDPTTVPDSLPAFAVRVDQLLAAYEQEAHGKLKVTHSSSPSPASASAAQADGIKPFNIDKGDACYLGITVALQGRKESLAQLSPEWESALEADLTRAVARLLDAAHPAPVPAPVSQIHTAATQTVQALLPNPAAVSVEEGTRILRESALKEFQTTAKEMEARVKEAQQQVLDANGKSEAEQQAATKHLQQVQAEQTEKLKEIAAKSKAQIEVFQQLKSAAQ